MPIDGPIEISLNIHPLLFLGSIILATGSFVLLRLIIYWSMCEARAWMFYIEEHNDFSLTWIERKRVYAERLAIALIVRILAVIGSMCSLYMSMEYIS